MSAVADFLAEIQTMYRRDYKDDEISFMRDRLFAGKYSQQAMIRALAELEKVDSDFLPIPKKVLAEVEKAEYNIKPKQSVNTEGVKNASTLQKNMGCKLVDLILSGKATRGEILEMYRKAEHANPDKGWAKAAMELEAHYKLHNMPLDGKPETAISFEL